MSRPATGSSSSRAARLLIATLFSGLLAAAVALCLLYAFSTRPLGANGGAVTVVHGGGSPKQRPSNPGTDGQDAFTLHPQEHIFREAQTIHLTWNVTKARRAPDGVVKAVYLINGKFPGPIIEARSGDELVVNVHNSVHDSDEGGIAVHWHGLTMKGANEMDGAVGLTQCAIAPSDNFTYRFRIDESQSGTYWYHAHSGVQRADGLFGGLVIHKPAQAERKSDLTTYQYETEQLLLVGDWYHRQAGAVLDWYQDPNHYMYEPAPDSLLINGKGWYNCSMAVKARPVNCSETEKPAVVFGDSKRVRLRVVNTGISSGVTMSISQGNMKVIAVDGGGAVAHGTPAVGSIGLLYPGERMDLIVDRHVPTTSESHESREEPERQGELTITLDRENMGLINFALTREQSFQLLWAVSRGDAPNGHSQRGQETISQFNLADAAGLPLGPSLSAIASPQETAVLYSTMRVRAANHNRPVGTVNHTSWVVSDPSQRPLLSLDREEWAGAIKQPTPAQTLTVPWFRQAGEGRWVELVLNNFDDKGHPFHLHGHSFYVVATHHAVLDQNNAYNPFDPAAASQQTVNTATPLRKDTIYVPPMGYVILRFALDNEGLWLLHCHVLWHQAVGMGIVLQVGDIADDVKQRASELCPR
ncbi:L-ascorbate oxidase [Tolypocladium ophioglossoides CBS 100239]|uniref:L-ascorbate oxidase n=1 Tax=Tolypocladium ophioglossoides (strain CBS 100239) TaxID=1163406 RepID=A0A0L0MZC8_TOLOC|nr:L-ascorbate oxidase [Tolypocladium ophioglossoides CBS 100239]